jgi:hypothetical protein
MLQRTAFRSYEACWYQRLASAFRWLAIEDSRFLGYHLGKGIPYVPKLLFPFPLTLYCMPGLDNPHRFIVRRTTAQASMQNSMT